MIKIIKNKKIKIQNKTKNTEIDNIEFSTSIARNTRGLMFKKSGRMLMEFIKDGKSSIWMPFMRFSLDLIFIDNKKTIVDIKPNAVPLKILKPSTWKLYFPKERCRYVLEIESKLAKAKKFDIGDQLIFSDI
ncbi:MAG: DUF192 domain-containing protein [Candidatus Aenigmarchaeota archaeon]|nr:DUF192 domain-containing protein [Candidatus Aenigmarchaeota archaeon]